MKPLTFQIYFTAIVFAMTLSVCKSYGQSNLSLSAGPDFSTLQAIFGGQIAPLYNSEEKLRLGLHTPISLTGHYTYNPIASTSVNSQGSQYNVNLVVTASASLNLSYRVDDDISVRVGAGYGALANSEPMSMTLDSNNMPSNEALDYLTFGTQVDLGLQYQKFNLSFAHLINFNQAFLTYMVNNALYAGIGYRQLNQLVYSSGNSLPKKPSSFQATIGLRWGK